MSKTIELVPGKAAVQVEFSQCELDTLGRALAVLTKPVLGELNEDDEGDVYETAEAEMWGRLEGEGLTFESVRTVFMRVMDAARTLAMA